jgi:DNA-binding response OmpR family regulator
MSERKSLILIVEDDEELARLNGRLLMRKGYEVLLAFNAAEARARVRERKPDLFVLDVMLPDGDGFELCEEFRLESDAPVLFLTGKKAPGDKIEGLGLGGDYYLVKPYDRDEFVAVVQSLLRRAEQTRQKIAEVTEITRGPLALQIPQGKALVNGRDAELTPKEFAVLLMLAKNTGNAMTAEQLYQSVWSAPIKGDTGAIRAHIANLKGKIGTASTDDFDIVYERGKGYSLIVG